MTSIQPQSQPRKQAEPAKHAQSSIAPPAVGERMRRRQLDLGDQYRSDPSAAVVADIAYTRAQNCEAEGALDPQHTWLRMGHGDGLTVPVGVHPAVGGLGDLPVPGDILAAALAACTDSTIRVVANALGIELIELGVEVEAHVDVRGTLCIDKDVPVAFQNIDVRVKLRAVPGTNPKRLERLVATAEHCCVVMRTLREGVPVAIECDAGAN